MLAPTFLALWPDQDVHCGRIVPGLVGQPNTIDVANATPDGVVILGVSLAPASTLTYLCGPAWLGVKNPALLVLGADGAGDATLNVTPDATLAGRTVYYQVLDAGGCRLSNLVVQTL